MALTEDQKNDNQLTLGVLKDLIKKIEAEEVHVTKSEQSVQYDRVNIHGQDKFVPTGFRTFSFTYKQQPGKPAEPG